MNAYLAIYPIVDNRLPDKWLLREASDQLAIDLELAGLKRKGKVVWEIAEPHEFTPNKGGLRALRAVVEVRAVTMKELNYVGQVA